MITTLPPTVDLETVVDVVERDGVVIIERLADAATMDRLTADLQPYLDDVEPGGGTFFGRRAKILSAVPAKSPAYAEMISDPLLLGLAERVIGPNCHRFQLQATSVLQVWPGGDHQPLHRDRDVYAPFLPHVPGGPEHTVSLIWAGTDFTAENGATHFVPGSHLLPSDERVPHEQSVQAAMPRGSVAAWRGSVLHGMGVNRTDEPRTGVIGGYSVGWLRQEENAYLACPPDVARQYPPAFQQLLGYQVHSPVLGWADGTDPDQQLEPSRERGTAVTTAGQ